MLLVDNAINVKQTIMVFPLETAVLIVIVTVMEHIMVKPVAI
jgi:hypothetical protein